MRAKILHDTAKWMVAKSPELAARATVYADRIECPGNASSFVVLPANSDALEGQTYTTALLDEAGFADPAVYETLLDSQGAYENSRLILLGTPGPSLESPLARLREKARTEPDPSVAWVEYSADDMRSCAWDDPVALAKANPALGDFLFAAGVDASRPPKTSEPRWRRVRLGQWVSGDGTNFLSRSAWDECKDDCRLILPGAPVVVSVDGSKSDDATAICVVSIEAKPIIELAAIWEPRELNDPLYRIPYAEVEQKIRDLADIYDVRELVADPAGFRRSLEILGDEGIKAVEHPNSNERMGPALEVFRQAVFEHEITHDGNRKLAAHVENAVVKEVGRGIKVQKPSPRSRQKIDALVASVMGLSRARWHAAQKVVQLRDAATTDPRRSGYLVRAKRIHSSGADFAQRLSQNGNVMNYSDTCTVTGKGRTSVDPSTGVPVLADQTILSGARCAFAVLSAADREQAWGNELPATQTNVVTASLVLPNYTAQLAAPLSAYAVSVSGYQGVWRVVSARPGASWTTYQIAQS